MLKMIGEAYREAARAVRALPLLVALAAGAEMIQHVIEYRVGMFASIEAMEAVGQHPARLGFGQVKILALVLLVYWMCRWLAYRDDPGRRVVGDARSAWLFLWVVLYGTAMAMLQHFGSQLLAPLTTDANSLLTIGIVFFILFSVLEIYLTVWKVGAALGNPRLGVGASFRIMHGNFWWSLGYFLAMMLPLMIVHYALNALAVGRPDAILWPILILDALIVACLGLVLAATLYLTARRATERAEVRLAAPRAEMQPA